MWPPFKYHLYKAKAIGNMVSGVTVRLFVFTVETTF